MKLYFKDNFFNTGRTTIYNEQQKPLGEVDLRGVLGSALDVYDGKGRPLYNGKFPLFSNKWEVFNENAMRVGRLRSKLSFFSKRYRYDAYGRGIYEINSPAFSRDYVISEESGNVIASFQRINEWFSSQAYCLDNQSDHLSDYELIAVIMGINAIQKRQRTHGVHM